MTTAMKATKCDSPVTLPGGLTAGCTLLVPPHVPGADCKYEPPAERFDAKIVLCPICGSVCGDTNSPSEETGVYNCDNCEAEFRLDHDMTGLDNVLGTEAQAMVMCPLCQDTFDVPAWGTNTITCKVRECGTIFTVNVNQDAVAEFSMFG